MAGEIRHECGIALLRFKQPFSYYVRKYGSLHYCVERLFLLMQKQHNRGQDGAGIVGVKLHIAPGKPYMQRTVSHKSTPIEKVFKPLFTSDTLMKATPSLDEDSVMQLAYHTPILGEIMLGHLRYGTYGNNTKESCHPFIRPNNWRVRNLALAGNFNMTNNHELFRLLLTLGQYPIAKSDGAMVLEKIGHFLDEEVQRLYKLHKRQTYQKEIGNYIESELHISDILRRACKDFDGGYVLAGVFGHGAAFVARDAAGIRPAYYYENEEVVVVTSEKAPIKAVFDAPYHEIQAVLPAHALIISREGDVSMQRYRTSLPQKSCVFERIYFSRASDPEIYRERKVLGKLLAPSILKTIHYDLEHTVFSFIPNTAEVAFVGMLEGISEQLIKKKMPLKWPRIEKLISKDLKLRTFITEDKARKHLVSNIYDVTYEVIEKGVDQLVVLDDSIVRGTTLQRSILTLLAKLEPKKIVIVSAAPQIRYPDCYGIDMSRMHDFIAFRATIALLKERGQENILKEIEERCTYSLRSQGPIANHVQALYHLFSEEEISEQIAKIIKPPHFLPTLKVLFLPIQALKKACPAHKGNWYFTGNYPTIGGNRIVNQAFIDYMKQETKRAY